MKKLKGLSFLLLVAVILSMSLLTGCGEDTSGGTIDEPEITADYLESDYASQLTTDGAGIMLGSVTIEKDGDSYRAEISEKEVIPSSSYDEGYYIADTNVAKDIQLGSDARITSLSDGEKKVITADEFIENNNDQPDQLYNVYIMGESAELILAMDPKDVMTE